MSFTPLFRKKMLQTFVVAFLFALDIGAVNILGPIIYNNIKGHGIALGIYGIVTQFRLIWKGTTVFSWLYSSLKELGMLSYYRKVEKLGICDKF